MRNELFTTLQSTPTSTYVRTRLHRDETSADKPGDGLKIRVSAVRFCPWPFGLNVASEGVTRKAATDVVDRFACNVPKKSPSLR